MEQNKFKVALQNLMNAADKCDEVNEHVREIYKREGPEWEAWEKAWNEAEKLPLGLKGIIIMAVALLIIKLTNLVSWSWWFVLTPIWVPVVVIILLYLISVLFIK